MSRLDELRSEALAGGGDKKIKKRREDGKLTARERLHLLLDPETFNEMGMLVTHNCNDFGNSCTRSTDKPMQSSLQKARRAG